MGVEAPRLTGKRLRRSRLPRAFTGLAEITPTQTLSLEGEGFRTALHRLAAQQAGQVAGGPTGLLHEGPAQRRDPVDHRHAQAPQ